MFLSLHQYILCNILTFLKHFRCIFRSCSVCCVFAWFFFCCILQFKMLTNYRNCCKFNLNIELCSIKMKIHISSQMQRIISSSNFFSQLYYFAENTKPEKLTAPVWKRRWWMNTDEKKVKLKAKKKEENTSWKMYPHPNDDIIAILYTLQFFISSVRSLLWLLSSFLCFVCVSVCLWNSRYLCILLHTGTRFHFGVQFYAELNELFDYYYCFVSQLQNVMAHIFPMWSGFFYSLCWWKILHFSPFSRRV